MSGENEVHDYTIYSEVPNVVNEEVSTPVVPVLVVSTPVVPIPVVSTPVVPVPVVCTPVVPSPVVSSPVVPVTVVEEVVTSVKSDLTAEVTQAIVDVSSPTLAVATPAVPKTPAAAFMATLSDMILHKPQSAAEAAALYEYLLHKEIIPLMKQLQTHVASELPNFESNVVAGLFSKGTNLQEALMNKVTGCFSGFFKR